jgi:hypothetical protein
MILKLIHQCDFESIVTLRINLTISILITA